MNKIQIRDAAFESAAAGAVNINPFKEGSWQFKAWADGDMQGREVALIRIRGEARQAAQNGEAASNPHTPHTPQWRAYVQGWYEGQAWVSAFAGASGTGSTLRRFPARMPDATREHVRQLNMMALQEKCSSRALRLDNKISVIYQRYA